MGKWIFSAIASWAILIAGCASTKNIPPGSDSQTGSAEKNTAQPKKDDKMPEIPAVPVVTIETSLGTIKAELWPDKAPETVKNFLQYVHDKFYDGLIFHRVIDTYMIQGGGFTPDMKEKENHAPIRNEASAEAGNARGTLAMARTSDIHSATSQFFVNLLDNNFLNHRSKTPEGFGFCAFGKVISGMDVVDAIGKVRTGNRGHFQDVPVDPVIIKSVRLAR